MIVYPGSFSAEMVNVSTRVKFVTNVMTAKTKAMNFPQRVQVMSQKSQFTGTKYEKQLDISKKASLLYACFLECAIFIMHDNC